MALPGTTAKPALKICGVTHADDLRHCRALGVDFVGFNFFPGSKRFVPPAAARALWQAAGADAQVDRLNGVNGVNGVNADRDAGPATRAVAVMVEPTPGDVAAAVAAFPELAVVQFHGRESPALLRSCRGVLAGRSIWRAVAVSAPGDVAAAAMFTAATAAVAAAADLVLFDSGRIPAGATAPGGSGERFDWRLLARWPAPFGLAGGLRPGVIAAAAQTGAVLLDLSSGVETTQPGRKDPALVTAVWRELREAVRAR